MKILDKKKESALLNSSLIKSMFNLIRLLEWTHEMII